MEVWISKYALTRGVFRVIGEQNARSMITVRQDNGYPMYYHGEDTDWHRTEADAKAKADRMRITKIASLKKQLDKLEKMKF